MRMIAWQKEDFFPPPPLDARAGWVANQVVRFGRLGQKSAIILGTVAIARIQKNKKSGVPRQLLQELNYNLAMRYVSSGIELLNRHEHLFASVGPEQGNSAAFVGCVAPSGSPAAIGEQTTLAAGVSRIRCRGRSRPQS